MIVLLGLLLMLLMAAKVWHFLRVDESSVEMVILLRQLLILVLVQLIMILNSYTTITQQLL